MTTKSLAVSLAAAALLAASCSDPPPTGSGPATSPPPAGTDSAAAPSSPAPTAATAAATYDPAMDPLVNRAKMLEPPPADRNMAAVGDWLYANLDGSPATLNPILYSSLYEDNVDSLLYDSLFAFDSGMQWKVNEAIVESCGQSEDHKVWTIVLKPGLQWHDGHAFTTDDVVFSWKEILDDRVNCPAVKTGTTEVEKCEAVDPRTVRMTVKSASPTSKWDVYFPIIPKHLYEKELASDPTMASSTYYANLNKNPVGNGPYRFVEWRDQDKIVLERWDGYSGPKPWFQRVIFRIIPENKMAYLTFEKQEIDEMRLSAQQFAVQTTQSAKFREVGVKARCPQWNYNFIVWNMDGSNPFFKDARVRKAMTHATNLPLILERVTYNLYEPCYGIWHPGAPMFAKGIQLLGYDPKKSAALLDEAGWRIDPMDGWRKKDGVRFSFTINYGTGSPTGGPLTAILQDELKRLGVEMNIQPMEWAVLTEKVRKHEFQAEAAGWGTGTDPDLSKNTWKTEMYSQGRNYGGYSNKRVDELFDLAAREWDHPKRMAMYAEIQRLIYDEQPYTFVCNVPVLWAFNKRIRGVVFSPRGVWGFAPASLDWWVGKLDQVHGMK